MSSAENRQAKGMPTFRLANETKLLTAPLNNDLSGRRTRHGLVSDR
jgi:hypothetical protein